MGWEGVGGGGMVLLKIDTLLGGLDGSQDFSKFQSKFPDPEAITSVDFCTAMGHEYFELMQGLQVTETSEQAPELTDEHDELLKDNFIYRLVQRNAKIDMKVLKSPFKMYERKSLSSTSLV